MDFLTISPNESKREKNKQEKSDRSSYSLGESPKGFTDRKAVLPDS
jgi:hypothetical protein